MGVKSTIDFDRFEIVGRGSITITIANPAVAGTFYTGSKAHNLGYQPVVMGFMAYAYADGYIPLPRTYLDGSVDASNYLKISSFLSIYADSTNVSATYVAGNEPLPTQILTGGLTVKYYLLRESMSNPNQ